MYRTEPDPYCYPDTDILINRLDIRDRASEGNGRTQLSFLVELSERAGHPLNLDRLDPSAILSATITSFDGDSKQLADIIYRLTEAPAESD